MAIEPVTREERFLAAAGGRSVTPPAPITRKEQLLQGIIDAVKSGGATPDVIKGAVNDYLNANPVKPGATTEQAAQIEQNKNDIADLQTEVDELKESGGNGSGQNVNIFSGATALFFGDSLTEQNWHYTKGYHKWIKGILGLASYINYGVSGYKISDVYDKVTSVTDGADIIFVMAGVNDQQFSVPLGEMGDTTSDTIYGALYMLCGKLKEKYPTSIIIYITPAYQSKYPHSSGITSYEVAKAIREVCGKFAIAVYDNFVLSGIYSTNLSNFTTDRCHWNDKAHEMVGKNLSQFMLATFGCLPTTIGGDSDDSGDDSNISDEGMLYSLPTATTFDGSNHIDTGIELDSGDWTIALDFTWDEVGSDGSLLFGHDTDVFPGYGIAIGQLGGTNNIRAYVYNVNGYLFGYGSGMLVGNSAKLVITRDGATDTTECANSVNGVTKNPGNGTCTFVADKGNLYIGGCPDGDGTKFGFIGTVHACRIYNRILSEEEIAAWIK